MIIVMASFILLLKTNATLFVQIEKTLFQLKIILLINLNIVL